ncbi:putative defensin-like protein 23 [Eutrema salsugineum]|uniref:putative defensin-like protein 23 n=1 Tax=Eutrema salsugineum TaxID=72664 RepID=UPI000CED1194|nr:putative defensin-like protein 23 [Eutrema salsugineum]
MSTIMKLVSFAMLLILLLSVDVEGSESDGSLCCNTHPNFGVCKTQQDKKRCNTWCLKGCKNKKGGFCKRLPSRPQCHCYC